MAKKPLMTAWTWDELIKLKRCREDEVVEKIASRFIEERGYAEKVPMEVLEHLGERRRFIERRVTSGSLRTTLPGFVGRIIDVKPRGRRWCYLVSVSDGTRVAAYEELEIVANTKKKRRRTKKRRRERMVELDLRAQLEAALANAR